MKNKTYTLDEIDTILGKNEERYRKTIKRTQKKCPHDFKPTGADHLKQYYVCACCGLEK